MEKNTYDIVKKLENIEVFMSGMDKRIENKVNPMLLKHIGSKWNAPMLIVGMMAFCIVALFYFNDKSINSSIQTNMLKYNERIDRLEDSLGAKIDSINDKLSKRDPNSITEPELIEGNVRLPGSANFNNLTD